MYIVTNNWQEDYTINIHNNKINHHQSIDGDNIILLSSGIDKYRFMVLGTLHEINNLYDYGTSDQTNYLSYYVTDSIDTLEYLNNTGYVDNNTEIFTNRSLML